MRQPSLANEGNPIARTGSRAAFSWVFRCILVAFAYCAAVRLGLAIHYPGTTISPLSPANAVLFAALLLSPRRTWWVVFLAAVPAHFAGYLGMGVPNWWRTLALVHNALLSLLAALGVQTVAGFTPSFGRLNYM